MPFTTKYIFGMWSACLKFPSISWNLHNSPQVKESPIGRCKLARHFDLQVLSPRPEVFQPCRSCILTAELFSFTHVSRTFAHPLCPFSSLHLILLLSFRDFVVVSSFGLLLHSHQSLGRSAFCYKFPNFWIAFDIIPCLFLSENVLKIVRVTDGKSALINWIYYIYIHSIEVVFIPSVYWGS